MRWLTSSYQIFNGPSSLCSMISPQRNSFSKPNESGQEAPVLWPHPLGLGVRGGSIEEAVKECAKRSRISQKV